MKKSNSPSLGEYQLPEKKYLETNRVFKNELGGGETKTM